MKKNISQLAQELEADLLQLFGTPIIGDEQLQKALGYKTLNAFRQAVSRKTVPVPVFTMEKQHGKFALVKDVAQHLAEKRYSVVDKSKS